IEKSLKRNFYYWHREQPYRNVPHRIIAEQYLEDESGWQLKDYKIFCFNGTPKFIEVDYDRYVDHKLNVYDLNWQFVDFYMTSRNDKNIKIERPQQLEKMIDLAAKLAKDEVFARVDFYSIGTSLYFGEMTYCPGGGIIDFHPDEYDITLGDMLKLPID
ncbi:MAG: glycosyl transferase, partial [Prevotella sp.]|nr:glycosyl transferase [Prevotella sp.]